MSKTVIKVDNLSKQYRLGQVGTGTLSHDLNRWWHRVRGKEDPYLKIGETNDRSSKGQSEYVWALKDINFEVKEGEVLGIIGKNGAGKSTLLKILSKVTGPTTGAIKAKGRIASLLEVGTGFHPELTGRENIYLNGTILGMTKAEVKAKLDEIVDFAGVERYLDTPVKRYSSGMMVRLGFAVAAHLEPEILIVDEVLAVGDAEFQKKAIGKMQDVSTQGGRTVLFVSHNMGSVKSLCNNCLLLQNGSIEIIDSTEKVISKYLENNNIHKTLIREREDRKGVGEIKIKDIKIFKDRNFNNPVSEVLSGDAVHIRIDYESNRNEVLKSVVFGLQLFNRQEQFMTALNNKTAGCPLINLSSNGSIYCTIDKLPLMSGVHYLTVALEVNGILQDFLHFATSFNVIPFDFFGSGVEASQGRQGVYVDQKWHVDED